MEKKKVKPQIKQSETNHSHEKATRVKVALVGIVLLLLLLFPKPQLIRYEYANMVSESIYWDGLYGPAQLLDSNAKFVSLDEDTDHLHVCFNKENDNCLRYKIIENKGFGGYLTTIF